MTTDNSRVVICNEGYTIERYIHGMDAAYNDIQEWRYKDLVSVFGADPEKSKTYQIKTKQEAEDLFKDENFSSAPYLQVRLSLSGAGFTADNDSLWSCTCPKKMHLRHLDSPQTLQLKRTRSNETHEEKI